MTETPNPTVGNPAEQTAPAPDPAASQPGNGKEAQVDDLDAIYRAALEEHGDATQVAPTPPEPTKPPDEVAKLTEKVSGLEQNLQDQQLRAATTETMQALRSEFPVLTRLADDQLIGMMDVKAKSEPGFWATFNRRSSNPGAWNKVRSAYGQELANTFGGQPDPQRDADEEAARASIRGQSTSLPPEQPVDGKALGAMSDAEYNKWAAERVPG